MEKHEVLFYCIYNFHNSSLVLFVNCVRTLLRKCLRTPLRKPLRTPLRTHLRTPFYKHIDALQLHRGSVNVFVYGVRKCLRKGVWKGVRNDNII